MVQMEHKYLRPSRMTVRSQPLHKFTPRGHNPSVQGPALQHPPHGSEITPQQHGML